MRNTNETIKTTLRMALPAIVESFFVCFAGLVDSLMVSSLGPAAVAAIGITAQPKFLGMAVFTAMSVSLSALVARRYGEKERNKANSILFTAVILIVVLSILIGTIMTVFASPIIRLCGSNSETHAGATLYFKIIMSCMIFNCLQVGINAVQRGSGNTKITMRTNVTSNTVNIILNYLLIGGKFGFPALGIKGAAIATVLGTVVSCIMSVLSIMKKDCFANIPYILENKIRPSTVALVNIVKVGYSIFLEQVLLRVGFMATAVMAAKQGTGAMAAHQACMHILSLSFAFGEGLQHAAVALIGRSLGENNHRLAKEYGNACQKIGGFISIILVIVFLVSSRWIMGLFFKNDKDIIEIGVSIMYVMVISVLVQIRQCIYMGSLRGAGDTRFTAFVSAFSVTIIRTVVSYLCCYTLGLGIVGVWLGVLGDQITRFIMAGARFRQGKWVNIKI